jgi:hypothetical protein
LAGLAFRCGARQCRQVFAERETLRLALLRFVEALAPVHLGGGQRRQLQRRAKRELVRPEHQLPLEQRREHHRAGDDDPLRVLQRTRHLRRAKAAIALAKQEFRRRRAVVVGDIERDRLGDALGIGVDVVVLGRIVGFHGAAPAGADRVDQHEVGEVEPAVRIVDQLGAGPVIALRPEIDDPRSDEPEMQKGRCRARSAVEGKGQRPVLAAVLLHVGGIEDRGGLCPILAEHVERPGGSGVGKLLSADRRLVLCHGIVWQQFQNALAATGLWARGLVGGRRAAAGCRGIALRMRQSRGKSGKQGRGHKGGSKTHRLFLQKCRRCAQPRAFPG